jgi:hypothetical protein
MRDRRLIGFSALFASLVLASISPLSVSAAGTPTRFGARLSHSTQADPGKTRCDDSAHVHTGATCTWIAIQAFENGDHQKAPRDGTIHKVRLISCVGGSFVVQVARKKPSQNKWKVVHSGPTIHYVADNQSGGCGGGPDADKFVIQSFPVNFSVHKGDYIAVKAKGIGFMHSSSSGPTLLFDPALAPGGSYIGPDSAANDMLLQFQY